MHFAGYDLEGIPPQPLRSFGCSRPAHTPSHANKPNRLLNPEGKLVLPNQTQDFELYYHRIGNRSELGGCCWGEGNRLRNVLLALRRSSQVPVEIVSIQYDSTFAIQN